jgi:hypothetical protein
MLADSANMENDKLHNLLHDPNVQFYFKATPRLRELIAQGQHPNVLRLTTDMQSALLQGLNITLHKEDVEAFVRGELAPHESWLFQNCDIRVVGQPAIKVDNKEGQQE